MNPEDQTIKIEEYNKYLKGQKSESIEKIWKNLLAKIPMYMQDEAKRKGYILKEGEKYTSFMSLVFEIPNASSYLQDALFRSYPFAICFYND